MVTANDSGATPENNPAPPLAVCESPSDDGYYAFAPVDERLQLFLLPTLPTETNTTMYFQSIEADDGTHQQDFNLTATTIKRMLLTPDCDFLYILHEDKWATFLELYNFNKEENSLKHYSEMLDDNLEMLGSWGSHSDEAMVSFTYDPYDYTRLMVVLQRGEIRILRPGFSMSGNPVLVQDIGKVRVNGMTTVGNKVLVVEDDGSGARGVVGMVSVIDRNGRQGANATAVKWGDEPAFYYDKKSFEDVYGNGTNYAGNIRAISGSALVPDIFYFSGTAETDAADDGLHEVRLTFAK